MTGELRLGEAAELLNVSKPFVATLVDRGELQAHIVDGEPRLLLHHALTYKRARMVD